MTRENKLALIVGFSLLLVVAVLLADHLSPAQRGQLAMLDAPFDGGADLSLPAGNGTPVRREFGSDQPISPEPEPKTTLLIDPPKAMEIDFVGESQQAAADDLGDNSFPPPDYGDQTTTEPWSKPIVMNERINVADKPSPDPGPQDTSTPVTTTVRIDRGDAMPYIVKERDTLYGLCKQFYSDGSLYDELARFNSDSVPPTQRIRAGMTLWIPSRQALIGAAAPTPPRGNTQPPAKSPEKPATQAPAERKPQTPPGNAKTVSYKIKANDRLWDIAVKHLGKGHRYKEIVALNKDIIRNPDVLPVGKTIRIPAK